MEAFILIVFIFMILFIPNNNEAPLIEKVTRSWETEYSQMSDYYYGTYSHKYPIYLDSIYALKIQSIDYDKLKPILTHSNYKVDPKSLNKMLDYLDSNPSIQKIGTPFRINKNFSVKSTDSLIQGLLDSLTKDEIDILGNLVAYTSRSPYDDLDDSYQNAADIREYFHLKVLTQLPKEERKSFYPISVFGFVQQYRLYDNPKHIKKRLTVHNKDK